MTNAMMMMMMMMMLMLIMTMTTTTTTTTITVIKVLLMIQKERIAGTRMPDGRRTAMCPVLRAAIVLEAAMAPRRKAVMGPGGETVIVHRTLPECTCEERESRYQSFSNPITVIEEKDSSLRIEFHKVAMVVDNSSSPKNNTARSK